MKQTAKRFSSLIVAIGFLVAAGITYFSFIAPAYGNLQSSRQDEESRAQFIQNEQDSVKKVQTLISTYQGQTTLEDTISQMLPQTPDISGALLQLNGIARIVGLSARQFTIEQTLLVPGGSPSADEGPPPVGISGENGPLANLAAPLGTLTFRIQLAGSYEQFKNFVKDVETNIRIFNVKSFGIQPLTQLAVTHSATDIFNYDIAITAYYQSQNPSPQSQ